ncbi:hypothetical protein ACLOJK_032434 [Asimina triloba]
MLQYPQINVTASANVGSHPSLFLSLFLPLRDVIQQSIQASHTLSKHPRHLHLMRILHAGETPETPEACITWINSNTWDAFLKPALLLLQKPKIRWMNPGISSLSGNQATENSAMYTYVSSTAGTRNRGSFSFCDSHGMNERTVCHYIWNGLPSINGFVMPPRILYGLRQSALLQWSASRSLFLGGNYRNGYCRLVRRTSTCDCRQDYRICYPVKSSACDCQQDYQICYPAKGRRRGHKIACVVSDDCDSGSEGTAEDIIGLMTDIMASRSRNRNCRLKAESDRKAMTECCCCHRNVNEVGVDDHSRREEKHIKSSSQGRKSNAEVHIRQGEKYRQSRREESSRDDNRVLRKDGSTSSYYSVLSSGEFGSSTDEGSLMKHGKVIGETSSGHQNRSVSERMGSCKEEVKKIQEYRDERHKAESSAEKIADWQSMSRDDRPRLEAAESDTGWGPVESKKGDIRRVSIRENHSKLRIEGIEEHSDNRHYAESSRKRFAARESLKKDDGQRSDVVESDSDWHLIKGSNKHAEISETQKSSGQRDCISEKQTEIGMKNREKISASSANSVHGERWQFSQKDQEIARQKESGNESLQLNEISELHDDNIERPNTQKQLGTRVGHGREDTSSKSTLIEGERRQRRATEQLFRQTESRMKSQNRAEMSEIHDIDIERSSGSHKIFTTRVPDEEKKSTLALNLVQEKGDQSCQTDKQATRQNLLQTHSLDTERLKNSQRIPEMGINNQEESLTSVVNLFKEDRTDRYQTDEQVIRQRGSRRQSQVKMTEAHDSNIGRASSSSQMLPKTKPKDQAESSASGIYLGVIQQQTGVLIQDNRNKQLMVMPPQSELTSGGSKLRAFNENMNRNTSVHQEAGMLASVHKLDAGTKMDSMHNDTLGSAHRMESSSVHFVGDFVERLEREASTSQESSLIPKHVSEIEKDLVRFSTGSGTKGPSDEMWDVAGPSSEEPSGAEAPEKGSLTEGSVELTPLTNTGRTVAQRSSQSLWSYIADIVRLRWGARAESHTSHAKSGVQSSSGESLTSDAYFSGREPDNDNGENVEKGKKGLPKEQASTKDSAGQPSQRTSLTPLHGSSEMTGSQEERKHTGTDMLTSMGELQQSPVSRGASASGREGGQIKVQKGKKQITSSVETTYTPLPVVDNTSSCTGHLEVVTDKGDVSEIGIADERPIKEGNKNASFGTEGMEEELKQRKLQRKKQVLRERFDEWEEAFKLEQEQRKIDEMFMKEALIEAKKAADMWEVPVGAVLVQNGKIIARGYNLVEELRDSTAHAEMICIREASKLLHTWRLAEATLYVTLEPCPMCAGAILQARIDAVVWGAPNKLLGADGSWISKCKSSFSGALRDYLALPPCSSGVIWACPPCSGPSTVDAGQQNQPGFCDGSAHIMDSIRMIKTSCGIGLSVE